MVRIALPPPANPPDPVFHALSAGTTLFRLDDPWLRPTLAQIAEANNLVLLP